MGQEIVYCFKCATRLVSSDFEKGRAARMGNRVSCSACLPGLVGSLSSQERKAAPARTPARGELPSPRGGPRPASAAKHRPGIRPAAPAGRPGPLILLAAAGVVALLAIGLLMTGRGAPPPPAPATRSAAEPAPKVATEVAAESVPPAPVETPVEKAPGAKIRDLSKEVAELDDRARPLLAREAFQAAASIYEAARERRGDPEWKGLIEGRAAGIRNQASRLLDSLKEQAAAARRAGRVDEVKNVRDRVAGWGSADLAGALDVHLAAVPEPKPPSPALLAYRVRWTKAAAFAAARDFGAAAADLGRAGQETSDEEVRRAAAADAEEFRRMAAAAGKALGVLAGAGTGQPLALSVCDADGSPKAVSGKVVGADGNRIELTGDDGKPVFVELSDVAARTLAEHAPADRDVLLLLAALEGDATPALPERYAEVAKGAREKRPRRPAREDEARRLFYGAELEFRSPETLASAVEKYRSLIKEYADTRVVRGDSALVKRRSEAAREYVFAADALKGAGTFRLAPHPKVELAWTSGGVAESTQAVGNYVELQFAALEDVPYRAWVYAGACCLETFTFFLQATDLTVPNPKKTSEKLPAAPGDAHASTVKPSIPGVRALHASHGGLREPRRWEWVALPLPKFSAAGLKKVRVLAESAGFSVAVVFVSGLKTSPLSEAELNAGFERLRGAAIIVEEGLQGWWKLDETQGTVAADALAQGRAGKLSPRGVGWGKGRTGGAAAFGGTDAEIAVEGFEFAAPQITVAAWVRHETLPDRIMRYVTVGPELAVIRQGSKSKSLHFYVTADGQFREVLVENVLSAGQWHHVTGTWDGTTQRVYLDGKLVGQNPSGGRLASGKGLTIGAIGESLHGQIDDVRVYGRALSEEEVQVLAGIRAAPAARSAGLVGWWKLDEGAGATVTDATGTHPPGTFVGSPAWEKGKLGGALSFDGKNAWVSVPSTPALKITGDLTVAFWLKKTTRTASWSRFVGKGTEGSRNYGVWDESEAGRILFQQFDEKGSVVNFHSRDGLELGVWYHVACVARGKEAAIYLNGTLNATSPRSEGTPVTSEDPLTFGYGFEQPAAAVLDDIRIYNRGLRDVEIRALAYSGPSDPPVKTVDTRPWRPLFDGKTADFLTASDRAQWVVENGVLTHVAGKSGAAQSANEFGDGEFRFRFEATGSSSIRFTVRQGGEAMASVMLEGAGAAAALGAGLHEILVTCRGDALTATLDGRPVTLVVRGKPLRGHVQFNADGTFRVHAVDFRELPR